MFGEEGARRPWVVNVQYRDPERRSTADTNMINILQISLKKPKSVGRQGRLGIPQQLAVFGVSTATSSDPLGAVVGAKRPLFLRNFVAPGTPITSRRRVAR